MMQNKPNSLNKPNKSNKPNMPNKPNSPGAPLPHNTPTPTDILVIGGGAAGLLAAGRAAQCLGRKGRVVLLEKMEKTGRKIRITGKGRCNITNTKERAEWLSALAEHPDFFAPAFDHFPPQAIIQLLESRGLKLQHERGNRVFPASGKAWDVAEALTGWAKSQGVEIHCKAEVKKLLKAGNLVVGAECLIDGKPRMLKARQYIIATGGKSYSSTGSSGDGYRWMQQLGLRVSPLRPSLVPIAVEDLGHYAIRRQELKNVEVTIQSGDKALLTERGDVILDNGFFSGPIILRMSRRIVEAIHRKEKLTLRLNTKPALSAEQLSNRIDRELALQPTTLGDLLRRFTPGFFIAPMADRLKSRPDTRLTQIRDLKPRLISALREMNFPITGHGTFAEAIVTAGGVCTDQIDPQSMRTHTCSNLFIAGELLDLDANTGGYNLQIAFSTGYLAGESAAKNTPNP